MRRGWSMGNVVERPWGTYEVIKEGPKYWVKRIVVKPRQSTSLQFHVHRREAMVAVSGQGILGIEGEAKPMSPGFPYFIPATARHRLTNVSEKHPLVVIETAVGDMLKESDIARSGEREGGVMKAIIVGHGPSILAEPMGMLVDEHDVVIRLKRCQQTLENPDYFGTKTDVVAGSLTIAGELKGIGGADEYWIFVDSRHENTHPDVLESAKRYLSRPQKKGPTLNPELPPVGSPEHFNRVILDKELCDYWDQQYRNLRDEMGGEGHNHTSQGMKALIYAMHHLRPDELTLVGFDNIATGEFTWSITRGPEWQHYPDHRWDVEHRLLQQVANAYPHTAIGFLLPEDETTQGEVHVH